MTALRWINDGIGYRCPRCALFVAVPKRTPDPQCPRCPRDAIRRDNEAATKPAPESATETEEQSA